MLGRLAMSKTYRDVEVIVERFVVFLEHSPQVVHWKRSGNGWGLLQAIFGKMIFSALEKEWRLWAASARWIRSVGGAHLAYFTGDRGLEGANLV